jgi:hypothetical protein
MKKDHTTGAIQLLILYRYAAKLGKTFKSLKILAIYTLLLLRNKLQYISVLSPIQYFSARQTVVKQQAMNILKVFSLKFPHVL